MAKKKKLVPYKFLYLTKDGMGEREGGGLKGIKVNTKPLTKNTQNYLSGFWYFFKKKKVNGFVNLTTVSGKILPLMDDEKNTLLPKKCENWWCFLPTKNCHIRLIVVVVVHFFFCYISG